MIITNAAGEFYQATTAAADGDDQPVTVEVSASPTEWTGVEVTLTDNTPCATTAYLSLEQAEELAQQLLAALAYARR